MKRVDKCKIQSKKQDCQDESITYDETAIPSHCTFFTSFRRVVDSTNYFLFLRHWCKIHVDTLIKSTKIIPEIPPPIDFDNAVRRIRKDFSKLFTLTPMGFNDPFYFIDKHLIQTVLDVYHRILSLQKLLHRLVHQTSHVDLAIIIHASPSAFLFSHFFTQSLMRLIPKFSADPYGLTFRVASVVYKNMVVDNVEDYCGLLQYRTLHKKMFERFRQSFKQKAKSGTRVSNSMTVGEAFIHSDLKPTFISRIHNIVQNGANGFGPVPTSLGLDTTLFNFHRLVGFPESYVKDRIPLSSWMRGSDGKVTISSRGKALGLDPTYVSDEVIVHDFNADTVLGLFHFLLASLCLCHDPQQSFHPDMLNMFDEIIDRSSPEEDTTRRKEEKRRAEQVDCFDEDEEEGEEEEDGYTRLKIPSSNVHNVFGLENAVDLSWTVRDDVPVCNIAIHISDGASLPIESMNAELRKMRARAKKKKSLEKKKKKVHSSSSYHSNLTSDGPGCDSCGLEPTSTPSSETFSSSRFILVPDDDFRCGCSYLAALVKKNVSYCGYALSSMSLPSLGRMSVRHFEEVAAAGKTPFLLSFVLNVSYFSHTSMMTDKLMLLSILPALQSLKFRELLKAWRSLSEEEKEERRAEEKQRKEKQKQREREKEEEKKREEERKKADKEESQRDMEKVMDPASSEDVPRKRRKREELKRNKERKSKNREREKEEEKKREEERKKADKEESQRDMEKVMDPASSEDVPRSDCSEFTTTAEKPSSEFLDPSKGIFDHADAFAPLNMNLDDPPITLTLVIFLNLFSLACGSWGDFKDRQCICGRKLIGFKACMEDVQINEYVSDQEMKKVLSQSLCLPAGCKDIINEEGGSSISSFKKHGYSAFFRELGYVINSCARCGTHCTCGRNEWLSKYVARRCPEMSSFCTPESLSSIPICPEVYRDLPLTNPNSRIHLNVPLFPPSINPYKFLEHSPRITSVHDPCSMCASSFTEPFFSGNEVHCTFDLVFSSVCHLPWETVVLERKLKHAEEEGDIDIPQECVEIRTKPDLKWLYIGEWNVMQADWKAREREWLYVKKLRQQYVAKQKKGILSHSMHFPASISSPLSSKLRHFLSVTSFLAPWPYSFYSPNWTHPLFLQAFEYNIPSCSAWAKSEKPIPDSALKSCSNLLDQIDRGLFLQAKECDKKCVMLMIEKHPFSEGSKFLVHRAVEINSIEGCMAPKRKQKGNSSNDSSSSSPSSSSPSSSYHSSKDRNLKIISTWVACVQSYMNEIHTSNREKVASQFLTNSRQYNSIPIYCHEFCPLIGPSFSFFRRIACARPHLHLHKHSHTCSTEFNPPKEKDSSAFFSKFQLKMSVVYIPKEKTNAVYQCARFAANMSIAATFARHFERDAVRAGINMCNAKGIDLDGSFEKGFVPRLPVPDFLRTRVVMSCTTSARAFVLQSFLGDHMELRQSSCEPFPIQNPDRHRPYGIGMFNASQYAMQTVREMVHVMNNNSRKHDIPKKTPGVGKPPSTSSRVGAAPYASFSSFSASSSTSIPSSLSSLSDDVTLDTHESTLDGTVGHHRSHYGTPLSDYMSEEVRSEGEEFSRDVDEEESSSSSNDKLSLSGSSSHVTSSIISHASLAVSSTLAIQSSSVPIAASIHTSRGQKGTDCTRSALETVGSNHICSESCQHCEGDDDVASAMYSRLSQRHRLQGQIGASYEYLPSPLVISILSTFCFPVQSIVDLFSSWVYKNTQGMFKISSFAGGSDGCICKIRIDKRGVKQYYHEKERAEEEEEETAKMCGCMATEEEYPSELMKYFGVPIADKTEREIKHLMDGVFCGALWNYRE
ncbi:hypothetical protein ADUPG1_009527 [Aduncisulcus paluster]|uniref:Uncharacterized protein n=1 Tax=Aduncisulcus paluster TaxID=2918883 RepID=A0ABQ5KVV6_9EUKA|nr:hypothetical protein ADUPG1_009527 [Aduncisulcus paluster]